MSFGSLPPRVVVFDILRFHEVQVPFDQGGDTFHPYELFGYFKKDGLRHIWFIFRSISIYSRYLITHRSVFESSIENTFYFDPRKLFHLRLFGNLEILGRIVNRSKEMNSLESLVLNNYARILGERNGGKPETPPEVHDLFSSENECFPQKLRKLTIKELGFHKKWNNFKLWNRIEKLEFYGTGELVFELEGFLKVMKNELKNIRSLELSFYFSGRITCPKGTVFHLPRLEKLKLLNICNLRIEAGSKLKSVDVDDLRDNEMLTDLIMKHSTTLESLTIVHQHNLDIVTLLSLTKNNLKELDLRNVNNHMNRNLEESEENMRFRKSSQSFGGKLESLTLALVTINEETLTHEYVNLKSLNMYFIPSVSGTLRWPLSKNLRKLVLRSDKGMDSKDKIFITNEFKSLEELDVRIFQQNYLSRHGQKPASRSVLLGKGWNLFPNLRTLRMEVKTGDEDLFINFFREQKLVYSSLRSLKFKQCALKNVEWGDFENLEKLSLNKCISNGDSLLSKEGRFKKLEVLNVENDRFLTGKDWCFFENLKLLKIDRCEHIKEKYLERYSNKPDCFVQYKHDKKTKSQKEN